MNGPKSYITNLIKEEINNVLKSFLLHESDKKTYKILYHIGKRPPAPKPYNKHWRDTKKIKNTGWDRPYLKSSVDEGVFFSDNWKQIWNNHGIFGNVYKYRIPMAAIEEAGGFNWWDGAREIIFTKDLWEKYNLSNSLIGSINFDKAKEFTGRHKKFGEMIGANRPSNKYALYGAEEYITQYRRLMKFPQKKQKEILSLLPKDLVKKLLEASNFILDELNQIYKKINELENSTNNLHTNSEKNLDTRIKIKNLQKEIPAVEKEEELAKITKKLIMGLV